MSLLLRNVNSNMQVFVLKLVMTFVLTPIMLRHLGNYDYGIWEILGSVVGYMGLLDMGLSPTVSRFIARYRAKSNKDRLNQVYNTSLGLMTLAGVIAGGALILWGIFLPESIAPPGSTNIPRYSLVLMIVGIQMLFTFPGIVLISSMEGIQRFKEKNDIVILTSLVGSIIILQFIDGQNALILIALTNMVGGAIKYIYYFFYLRNSSETVLKLSQAGLSMPMVRELLHFGGKSFIQGTSHRVSQYADNLVISFFSGTASIVFFAIPNALLRHILSLIANITSAFLPFFSDKSAKGDTHSITRVYIFASKITVAITFLLLSGVIVLGDDFIRLWIGSDYAIKGRWVLYILSAYVLIHTINPFDNRLVTALARHGYFAKMSIVESVGNITCSLILAPIYGIEGVALGTLIPSFFVKVYTLRYCCALISIPPAEYIRSCIITNLIPALLVVVFLLTAVFFHEVTGYFWLLLYAGLSCIIWLPSVLFTVFSKSERHSIFQFLARDNQNPNPK